MLKLDLWQAFERHLYGRVCETADADEIARLPPLNGTVKEQDANIRLFIEILDNRERLVIKPRPRQVHVSDVLTQSPRYAHCELRILKIKGLLESGSAEINEPTHRYFSRRAETVLMKKALRVYLDRMFYDWGIHHMHLGETRRTNDLLFVTFRHDDAYFINVCSHGDFTTVSPLEVAQRNWPSLFEHLPGISGSDYSPAHVANLRKNNANYSPNVNGLALISKDPVTCDGRPIRLLREFDYMKILLGEQQDQLCTPGSEARRRSLRRYTSQRTGWILKSRSMG